MPRAVNLICKFYYLQPFADQQESISSYFNIVTKLFSYINQLYSPVLSRYKNSLGDEKSEWLKKNC